MNDIKLKEAMLDLLVEVKRVCDLNKIDYFLIGGTLIGAIRHSGYIPWDDDIDLGILRENFTLFKEACDRDLDERYHLVSYHNDVDNPNIYYKLKIKGTTYVEDLSKQNRSNKEVFIDIFPFDHAPNSEEDSIKQGRKIAYYRRLLSLKCHIDFSNNKSIIKNIINGFLKLVASFYSLDKLYAINESLVRQFNDKDTDYVVNAFGSYSYMRERERRSIFTDLIEVEFEGYFFKVPRNYHAYLTTVYGDYMQLPPVDQRFGRHEICKLDLNGYVVKSKIKGQ